MKTLLSIAFMLVLSIQIAQANTAESVEFHRSISSLCEWGDTKDIIQYKRIFKDENGNVIRTEIRHAYRECESNVWTFSEWIPWDNVNTPPSPTLMDAAGGVYFLNVPVSQAGYFVDGPSPSTYVFHPNPTITTLYLPPSFMQSGQLN